MTKRIKIADVGMHITLPQETSYKPTFKTPVTLVMTDMQLLYLLNLYNGPTHLYAVKEGFPDVKITRENFSMSEDELFPVIEQKPYIPAKVEIEEVPVVEIEEVKEEVPVGEEAEKQSDQKTYYNNNQHYNKKHR